MEARSASERVEPLLERDRQLEQLEDVLRAAERGRGTVALIEGAAGLGKSSLLTHARRAAVERGFLDLHATGDELERSFSFGVVHQLFAEPVRRETKGDGIWSLAQPSWRCPCSTAPRPCRAIAFPPSACCTGCTG